MKKLRLGGKVKNWRIINGMIFGELHGDDLHGQYSESFRSSFVKKITVETHNSIYALDPDSAKL